MLNQNFYEATIDKSINKKSLNELSIKLIYIIVEIIEVIYIIRGLTAEILNQCNFFGFFCKGGNIKFQSSNH